MNPKFNPTLKPVKNFDAYVDAENLQEAMKGTGADSKMLINIICRRSNLQRNSIAIAFNQLFGKYLINRIKSETSGNFQKVLIGLLAQKEDYYAKEIFEVLSSRSKKLDLIIDVLCLMTNKEISDISYAYQRLYGKPLAQHMREQLSGHFENMLISLAEGKRVEDPEDEKKAYEDDARLLKEAMNRIFKDEAKISEVFSLRSTEHLKMISKEYETIKGISLEDDIKNKFLGWNKDALLLRLNPENQSKHFARRMYESMAGLGTNDLVLVRVCITRCEIDMMDIKAEFQNKYSESLRSFIEGDTSGNYMNALLTLLGEADQGRSQEGLGPQ